MASQTTMQPVQSSEDICLLIFCYYPRSTVVRNSTKTLFIPDYSKSLSVFYSLLYYNIPNFTSDSIKLMFYAEKEKTMEKNET